MDPSFFSISYAEPFITASISWLEPPGPCFPFSHDTNSLALFFTSSRCHGEENEPRHLCLPTDGSTSTSAFVPPSLTPVHTVHVEDRRSHSSGPIFPPTVPRKLKQQERPIHQFCGLFTRTERKECAENEQGYTGIGAIDDSVVPGWGLGLTSRAEHRCCGSQEFVSLRFHPSNPRVVVQ
jgi:hypothetical protein